jgi:hypothetical protein
VGDRPIPRPSIRGMLNRIVAIAERAGRPTDARG